MTWRLVYRIDQRHRGGRSRQQENADDRELVGELRERRAARKVTQAQLAKMLGTSQPRVAAMEAGDPQTSLEALLRALLVLGATPTLKVA